ncbi:hypothetical protein [Streptomonospora litoralis]|uniref:Uncharacterized protein n=1 Tax=Streptomonospora litoralis TaxID=2498135 RepID=A0A4P6PYS7_9ACTN|nr:hypothetical protein [Streptomonospora litoralis]QBI53456.1 hypothetical protein EKD16_08310 [Streptomonospora litoralis]
MHEDSDGRECARGERCATYWIDDQREYRGAWGPRLLCEADRRILADAIAEFPELYAWLWLHLRPTSRPLGERSGGTGRAEAPLPIRGDVDALMRELYEVLASWEERVRVVARLTDRTTLGPQPAGRPLTRITTTLGRHLEVLLNLPPEPMMRQFKLEDIGDLHLLSDVGRIRDDDAHVPVDLGAADAVEEILTLHRRARARAGQTRRLETVPGVICPACELLAVVRESGSTAYCSSCRTPVTDADLEAAAS